MYNYTERGLHMELLQRINIEIQEKEIEEQKIKHIILEAWNAKELKNNHTKPVFGKRSPNFVDST